MSTDIAITRPIPEIAGQRTVTGLAALPKRMWNAHIERRTQQQAIAHLRGLNDHCLKDIGLSRSEIVAAVNGQL